MDLNSLMSGGYEPDIDLSLASDFELWLENLTDEERKEIENELH